MVPDARRRGYLLPRRETRLAFAGAVLAMFLGVVNQTVVTTALPAIVADIGGVDRYSWVFTAYMLALTASMPIYGVLSDRRGRRPFMLVGIVLLAVGSITAAIAGTMTQLIVARAVQGLGAGAMIPLALTAVGDLVPAAERGRWQAISGGVLAVATIGGPLLGGWTVDHLSWRCAFLAPLPLAAVCFAVVAATLRIPPHPDARRCRDYRTLVRRRVYPTTHAAGFLLGAAMFVPVLFVPLLLQGSRGETALASAGAVIPMMLANVVAGAVSGQLISRRRRYGAVLRAGPVVLAAGFVVLLGVDTATPQAVVVVAMGLVGTGVGLLMHNLVLVVQNGVPGRLMGIATSTTQLSRQLGGVVGVSLAGALFDGRLGAELAARGLAPGSARDVGPTTTGAIADPMADAIAAAIHPVFVALVPIAALLLVAILAIPEVPLSESVNREPLDPRDVAA